MTSEQLVQALRVIRDRLSHVLESDARTVLDQAVINLRHAEGKYSQSQRRTDIKHKPTDGWGYVISPSQPLNFKAKGHHGYSLRADIICKLSWQKAASLPYKQDLVLRVWCADPDLMYREHMDSPRIGDLVTSPDNPLRERVMLRYHFDLANPLQPGPRYHMQLGGNQQEGEYFWFPNELDLPRLVYHPLDIVLLCQLVVANFFPEEYKTLRADPSWRGVVKNVERYLLRDYYEECLKAVEGDDSCLLDHLWNTYW